MRAWRRSHHTLTPSFVHTAKLFFGATSSPNGSLYRTSTSSDGTSSTGLNFIWADKSFPPGRVTITSNGSSFAAWRSVEDGEILWMVLCDEVNALAAGHHPMIMPRIAADAMPFIFGTIIDLLSLGVGGGIC